jgi:UDP-galactopyranose mutase
MLNNPDYLVVGAGLTGATIARMLHDAGRRVVVVERRGRVAGNVHDSVHASGIRIHDHGPHYFRTSAPAIWSFVNRFADFYPFAARIKSLVDGDYVSWPLGRSYIARRIGAYELCPRREPPATFEEAALALMPASVYETFVKPYNEKQWGVPASALSPDLCRRFDVREDDEERLTPKARYQGLPGGGYTALVEAMLEGIPVLLNVHYPAESALLKARCLTFFTGPIDEYFDYCEGRLLYRAQRRTHTYLPDVALHQPCVQVNTPLHAQGPAIRTIEWKHLLPEPFAARIRGTVLTTETPYTPNDPRDYEYPFPDETNRALYRRYRSRAAALPDTVFCGRLGEYRYLDMDQAIGRAQTIAARVLAGQDALGGPEEATQ